MSLNRKQLVTRNHHLNMARQLIESIDEEANTAYYTFFGNHLEYDDPDNIPQPVDSVQETEVSVFRNMIYGKRITSADVALIINRNDYVANKPYDMYDDIVGEANLASFDSNYYAVVNADAYYHVWKCLDNNNGSNSTIQPEFSDIDTDDQLYQTSDGYTWKYMYSADSTTVRKFATIDFFPVVPNNQVAEAAIPGAIHVVKVDSAGRGYDNYCNGTFRTADLRLGSNSVVYSLNASTTANTANDFYNGCYLYIASGTGIGQYAKVVDYVVNSTFKSVVLDRTFPIAPASDSQYEVSPGVTITGDGLQTINCVARAIVNSAGNTIQRVEVLEIGRDYRYATANIVVANVVPVTSNASVRPIYSPSGGHGKDAAQELGATRVCFSTHFSNADINIPLSNDYRTIGIIKDPMFANVYINFSNGTSDFIPNEIVYATEGVLITNSASVNTTSAGVVAAADFENQLSVGQYVYLKTDSGYQLSSVNSITNSSYFTLDTTGFYACTATEVYISSIASYVSNVELTYAELTGNVSINTTSAELVGTGTSFVSELYANQSHLWIYANSTGGGMLSKVVAVANNTRASISSNGTFANTTAKAQIIDYSLNTETIQGVRNSPSAYVTSVAAGTIVTTNVAGQFTAGDFIIGANSGATGVITSIERNGVTKNFNTYNQMYKYTGTPLTLNFVENEKVYQSLSTDLEDSYANGYLHSTSGTGSNTVYYITNVLGIFNSNTTMYGANSGATATITNKNSPEIIADSGEIIFEENISGVSRSNTSSERIKLIFEL